MDTHPIRIQTGFDTHQNGPHLKPVILKPVIRIFRIFRVLAIRIFRIFRVFRVFRASLSSKPYFLCEERKNPHFPHFPNFALVGSKLQNAENPTDRLYVDRL